MREDRKDALHANDVWAMDFVHDQLVTSRKLRILTIIDTYSRYAPVIDPRLSYKGQDGVETLEHVCKQVGDPNLNPCSPSLNISKILRLR